MRALGVLVLTKIAAAASSVWTRRVPVHADICWLSSDHERALARPEKTLKTSRQRVCGALLMAALPFAVPAQALAQIQPQPQPPIGTQERKPMVQKEAGGAVAPRTTQPPFSNAIDIVNPKDDSKATAGK